MLLHHLAIGWSALVSAATLSTPNSLSAQVPAPDPIAVSRATARRLAGLADLYGAVFYFHPDVAPSMARRAAWDTAVARTVERIAAGASDAEYRAAVGHLVASLGDPATRLEPATTPRRGPRSWRVEREPGVLIVTLDAGETPNGAVREPAMLRAIAAAPAGDTVVVDLRAVRADDAAFAFDGSGIAARLTAQPVPGARLRHWWYRGWPAERPIYGASFRPFDAGWLFADGEFVRPAVAAQTHPAVVLLAGGAAVPRTALALRRAGLARIVAEGPVSDVAASRPYLVHLFGGLVARVRTARVVHADGATDSLVDGINPSSEGPNGRSTGPLKRALKLLAAGSAGLAAGVASGALASDSTSEPNATDSTGGTYPRAGMRAVAAYRIWNVLERFHPYRAINGEQGDRVTATAIPALLAARDSVEYARAVAEMAAHIHDSHVNVDGPGITAQTGEATIGIGLGLIEGKPVVLRLESDSLARATGLRPGDEIVAVDGEPAAARLARLARSMSASTPQALMEQVLMVRFLWGRNGSTAKLRVRGADGAVRTVSALRTTASRWWITFRVRHGATIQRLDRPGGPIGYVDLARLEREQVDSMFAMLTDTRAIIFDLRGYPSLAPWIIAPRLVASDAALDTLVESRSVTRRLLSPDTTLIERRESPSLLVEAAVQYDSLLRIRPRYHGRTYVLIDERTQSRGESSAMKLVAAGAVPVGEPSTGADGDVTFARLPGQLMMQFSGDEVLLPDGTQLQRRGIQPRIRVHPTIAGLRVGRDEVLDAALAAAERQ